MSDFVFNIAKGRVVEYYNRVKNNDPINSALVIVILKTAGLVSDATLLDYDTLSAILAGASDEATNTGYSRQTISDLSSFSFAPDDTNDRFDLDIGDITFTSIGTGAWSKLLVCYNPDTTSGTDASIIPLTAHDFVITPDGGSIIAQVTSTGFVRAS